MGSKPGRRSTANLVRVRPDLVKVVHLAFSYLTYPATVIDGVRDDKTQQRNFETGVSKVRFSKHQIQKKSGFGEAVDILPDGADGWTNETAFQDIRKCMFRAAKELKVKIRWGGDWTMDGKTRAEGDMKEKFVDFVHFEVLD